MNKDELTSRIDSLTFAMTEAQLFLDTHPDCPTALDYYRRTARELDEAMTEYQNMHSPLFADSVTENKWRWIEGPWPWQYGNGAYDKNADKKAGGEKK